MSNEEILRKLNADDKRMLWAFADEAMRVCPAARATYFNYRTFEYRLDSIYKKTGLNPRNFYDLISFIEILEEAESNGHS